MFQEKGFIQIIVIIILVIVIISLLGISLKEIFGKVSSNQTVGENFKYVTDWLKDIYDEYLAAPVGKGFDFIKNYIIGLLSNIPIINPAKQPSTQNQPATGQ